MYSNQVLKFIDVIHRLGISVFLFVLFFVLSEDERELSLRSLPTRAK